MVGVARPLGGVATSSASLGGGCRQCVPQCGGVIGRVLRNIWDDDVLCQSMLCWASIRWCRSGGVAIAHGANHRNLQFAHSRYRGICTYSTIVPSCRSQRRHGKGSPLLRRRAAPVTAWQRRHWRCPLGSHQSDKSGSMEYLPAVAVAFRE